MQDEPTSHRQAILKALRDHKPPADFTELNTGYTRAAMEVCYAIEQHAQPDELWEGGESAAELTASMNIGRHLAATRRFFGFIA